MKKVYLLLLFLIGYSGFSKGQEFYVKINSRYHLPVTTQKAPEYFAPLLSVAGQSGYSSFKVYTEINNFSLASGFSYGSTFGYKLNECLRVEIAFDYFRNNKTVGIANYSLPVPNLSTDWKFRTLNSVPTFVFGKSFAKSAFSAKLGAIIGLSSLEKTTLCSVFKESYKLKREISIGYMFGFEYNYTLNSRWLLSAEAGVENYFYTPRKASLIEDTFDTFYNNTPTKNIAEIEYSKEIINQYGVKDYSSGEPSSRWNESTKRLTETLKMNSAFIGIGFIYTMQFHEKN
jgi:hypothetical protein